MLILYVLVHANLYQHVASRSHMNDCGTDSISITVKRGGDSEYFLERFWPRRREHTLRHKALRRTIFLDLVLYRGL